MKAGKKYPFNGEILSAIVLILVIGSLAIAVIDKDSRPTFTDLAKVGVGGYIGLLMPRRNSR
jgi:hypothetical protein